MNEWMNEWMQREAAQDTGNSKKSKNNNSLQSKSMQIQKHQNTEYDYIQAIMYWTDL